MATYFVDTAVGGDGNLGTSEGAGNAWATIDKAMNTVGSSDKVWVKATGTYTEDALIDFQATPTTPVTFEGYTSTTGDGGQAVLAAATVSCIGKGTASSFQAWCYTFKNFRFTGGGSGASVELADGYGCLFVNCEFSGGGKGIGNSSLTAFYNCVFTGNTGVALDSDSDLVVVMCKFHGNSGNFVIEASGGLATIIGCLFYNNTGSNSECIRFNGSYHQVVIGCTFDGENVSGSKGIAVTSNNVSGLLALNNILYDLATGINRNTDIGDDGNVIGYNLINSNTTDYGNCVNTEGNDVTTAPAFTNEAGDDYTLGSSDAVDAGVDLGNV